MAVGQYVYVTSGWYYTISSVTDGTHVVLTNLGYSVNASPGTVISGGASITPGGIKGDTGATGATGPTGATGSAGSNGVNAYTTTASSYTQPAANSTVTVQVGTTSWMVAGENLFVGGGGGTYSIASIVDGTHVSLTNLGYAGNASPTTVISGSATVSPTGLKGDTGTTGATGATGPAGPTGNTIMALAADVRSTQQSSSNPLRVGGIKYDSTWTFGLSNTSTIRFHALIETTNAANAAYVQLYQLTGSGAPRVVATTTGSTATTVEEQLVDVSTFFRPGGTVTTGIYVVLLYLTTNNNQDFATCSGAWLEFTP